MVDSDKKYLKISEAAKLCGTKEHILRYWEKHFHQLKPIKRNTRRYYQQKDLDLILTIKDLLMVKKFTLDGAKKMVANSKSSNKKPFNQPPDSSNLSKRSELVNQPVSHSLFGNDLSEENYKKFKSARKKEIHKVLETKEVNNNLSNERFRSIKEEIIKDLRKVLKDLRA